MIHLHMNLRPYIILCAILVHIVWGVVLIINPLVVTPAAILVGLHWAAAFGLGGRELGVVLLAAAILALISLGAGTRLSNRKSLALLLPQFGFLVAAFLSDVQSIITGVLPDGRVVDQLLLFTSLCPIMIVAVLHSIAIIERHSAWTH